MTDIRDSFQRIHNYLRISVTDRCNLRCFYCMPEEGIDLTEKSMVMNYDEIIGIAKNFIDLGVDTIRLTGGEPLVRKGVDQLLEQLGELPVRLKITTNGILLDKFYDQFERIGLKDLNISLDSLDQVQAAFITKRDYFNRIMSNIEEGLKRRFNIKLNIVLIKGVNDNEIVDFVKLTKYKKLSVKFIEFMPFKGNKWDWSKGVSEDEVLNHLGTLGKIQPLINPPHSTSSNFQIAGHQGSFGIVSTITKPFCADCNRIRLTVDGKMKNCLFANDEVDLLTAYRSSEDIKPLILKTILLKKYSRDGMDVMDKSKYENNRSMTAIGG